MEYALITGITGFMGQQFIKEYMERYKSTTVFAIIRNKGNRPAIERAELQIFKNYIEEGRLVILGGSLEECSLLDDSDKLKLLVEKVSEIWHLAGATDFEETKRESTFRCNVNGISNILALAKQFKKLHAFYHYSTSYISHKGNGLVKVPENCLDSCSPANTNNPYEESKLLGERLVVGSGLPYVVFRPSIVMGHSQTGEAESDKMVYGALKCYFWIKQFIMKQEGMAQDKYAPSRLRICANPMATKNLISVDDVVKASLRAREKGERNLAYNLVNPEPTTVAEVCDAIFRTIGTDFFVLDPGVEKEDMNKLESLIYRATSLYKPYMLQDDPAWDMSNTLRLMKKNEFHKFDFEAQCKLYKSYIQNRLLTKTSFTKKMQFVK